MKDPWLLQRWAFEQQTGNAVRKAVLSMLAMMADASTGRCEAKQATLAKGVEVSERAVRGHLKALEGAGFIARRPQFRRDQGRRGDEFLLLAPGITEWPDGEDVRVQPANGSGGSSDSDMPVPAACSDRPPRKLASAQELPLGNDRSGTTASPSSSDAEWGDIPEEMRADAQAFLAEKRKVGSRIVTEREWSIACAALAEFNRQLGARNEIGSYFKLIVERIREHPSWDAAAHVRLVQSAFRLRWWERNGSTRRAKPAVIWSARAFPNVVDDATREAEALREMESDRSLRTKRFSGGRSWDELTADEQANAKEAVAMGLEPWKPRDEVHALASSNGHAGAVTADSFLDPD